jgi:23S rRNA (adenine2503-C2)-methyltransferase
MHAAQHPLAGRAQRPLLSLSDFSLARAPHDLRRAPDAPPARRARSAAGCAAAATAAAPAAAAPRPAATAAAAGPLRFPPEYYDGPGRLMLKCLTLPELEAWCASVGEDGRRRGAQLWRWMYADSVAWRAGAGAAPRWLAALDDAPAPAVQNGFSAAFRAKFAALATLDGGLALERVSAAADGTRKMVFRLTAGPAAGATVETVVIPITREAGAKARVTLCVSSQAGCAMVRGESLACTPF